MMKCDHRILMFWGSHSQENGVSCQRCGRVWIHRRRYLRTPRGRIKTVSRLVLTPRLVVALRKHGLVRCAARRLTVV